MLHGTAYVTDKMVKNLFSESLNVIALVIVPGNKYQIDYTKSHNQVFDNI